MVSGTPALLIVVFGTHHSRLLLAIKEVGRKYEIEVSRDVDRVGGGTKGKEKGERKE